MTAEFDQTISSIHQEVQHIASNMNERNQKYHQCLNQYFKHLNQEIQQFEATDQSNSQQKQMISSVFQNSYQRILSTSDVTVRKIKQTFLEKKEFWNNIIKINSDLPDLELKKEFYMQRNNAEELYFNAMEQQKIKHHPYQNVIGKQPKNQHLKQFQLTNKHFEEKVVQGSNTMHEWDANKKWSSPTNLATKVNVLDKFTANNNVAEREYNNEYNKGITNNEIRNNRAIDAQHNYNIEAQQNYNVQYGNNSFLNNFTKKR